MPNPSHISALRWYKEQKFTGAPQSLLIDGYTAVRDGRTVYVNAANIGSDNSFYTNIYVISYNQAAENATIDIFGQILSHWKFNTNIEEFKKIELVKDTARLADLADIRIALENYKQDPQHGYYPKLTSGSYLANKTISTWPSWQDTLAKELGGSLPTDPVNKLGKCDGYNETTCWNEQTKEFATTFPVLPAGSQAIVYSAAADGLSYSLCAVMTSGYVSPAEAGVCTGSVSPPSVYISAPNRPPEVSCDKLTGTKDKEFVGYIKGYDPDNDYLNWNLSFKNSAGAYVSWQDIKNNNQWPGWSDISLKPTSVRNYQRLYAAQAGPKGAYSIKVMVNDAKGGTASTICDIVISDLCGNDKVDSGEECEAPGNGTSVNDQYGCQSCEWSGGWCGDGAKNGPETCDDGNAVDNDACSNDCKWNCKCLLTNEIILSDGVGDGVVYDNNNNTNSAANVNGGSYLKLGAVMPTPYIWIANTDINKVAKIRTFDGKKRNCARNNGKVRCWWEDGTWETMGQLIGTYSVGTDPSRTAVNVETGDVWIGNRAGGSVTKLDINGNILKTCLTGAMVRGVIIDKDGDIWVSNYNSGTVVKISGDDTNCAILTTVNLGAGYGLTMDSENNVWVAHVGGGASKINTSNNYAITKFPAAGGYGITVDMYDNVWLGGYPSNNALVKFTKGSSDPKYFGPGYQGLGVSTDLDGNIWAGTYTANGVVKVDQNGNSLFGLQPNGVTFIQKNSGGSDAHGICGDSQNNIWVVNYGSGNTRVFNSNGDTLGTFNVYKTGEPSKAYTYSDMTGLNRAMIFRSGVWMSKVFDGGSVNQHWGKIEWQETVPADTTVEMSIRTSDDNVNWTEYDASQWNNLDLGDRRARYLQIQATLRSNKRGETPVIWGIKLNCN